jgi:penicillin amidase
MKFTAVRWICGLTAFVAATGATPFRGPTTELRVAGLTHQVEVYRDSFGTPHIVAQNNADLFVAFGYVTAEDRLVQLDLNRRAMSGRIAEIRGSEFVASDRYYRTLGLRQLAEAVVAKTDPSTRQVLEHFSLGVNAYIRSHLNNLPVEFQRLGYRPEPWTPVDSVLTWKQFGSDLDVSKWRGQIARARFVAKFGERAKELFPAPDTSATIIQPGEMTVTTRAQTAVVRPAGLVQNESTEGSNDWVVSAKKSVTGKPIFAADPHLPLTAPAVWYEVHLTGGDYDVAGIAIAGTPFVLMGNNARIAFAYTYSTINVTDVYQEKLNPANPAQYEYMGTWSPVQVRREIIPVKGQTPVTLDVRSTRHGPIMSEFTQSDGNQYALRWSDYEVKADEMHALRLMDTASNWEEFKAGVRLYNTLSGNFLYADWNGNIGYYAGAAVPIRRKGDGAMAVPGWTDEYEWRGYVPFEQLPHIYNPERGWIATANNTIAGAWYPYFLSNPGNLRAERIQEVMQSKDRFSIADFKALQSDVHSPQPKSILPILFQAFQGRNASAEVAEALDRLKRWTSADFNRESVAPTIYDAFYRRLGETIFLDEAGGDRELYRTMFGNVNLNKLLIEQPNSPWFDNIATPIRETRADVLVRSFEEGVAELTKQYGADQSQWRWGRRNVVTIPHQNVLGTGFGALYPEYSLGPFAKEGRGGWTIDPAGQNQYRMIVDLADLDNSMSALGPGTSGDPKSPHYQDQVPLWMDGSYHPKYFSREKSIANAESRHILKP